MQATDVHELHKLLPDLPAFVKVVDRRGNHAAKVKYGDRLILYRAYALSGFVAKPERGDNFLFIPSSYDGQFETLPNLYPLVDDLRQVRPNDFVRVTRTWRSPHRGLDSVYLDDRILVDKTDFVVIPELGTGEVEILVCRCRDPKTGEEMLVKLPMNAECHFEDETNANLKIFTIGSITQFPTRVEVHSRGSPVYLCDSETLIAPGRRLEIFSQVSVPAVCLKKENPEAGSTETFELLNGPHPLLVQPQAMDSTCDRFRLCPKSTNKFIHVLSRTQENTLPHVHGYDELEDDEGMLAAVSDIAIAPKEEPPPPPLPKKVPKASVRPMVRENPKQPITYEITEGFKPPTEKEDDSTQNMEVSVMPKREKPIPKPRTNIKPYVKLKHKGKGEHFV